MRECVDLEGASGPQSMRSDCPESDSKIVWHLRTFVWHVICITWLSAHRRILLNNAHLATSPSVHCCVRTLKMVGHRVGRVTRGLMSLLIQEASRVSEVLGVITEFRRVFSTTQIGRSCSVAALSPDL